MAKTIKFKNHGLRIEERHDPRDWVFGGYTGIETRIRVPDGQWGQYLPVFERQSNPGFDTFSCVSYSLLNCVEILIKWEAGVEHNFSDRYLATKSGTICGRGNWMTIVVNTLLEHGVPLEAYYPFSKDVKTCEEYFQFLTLELDALAEDFTDRYKLQWEWLSLPLNGQATSAHLRGRMKEALTQSPLQAVINNQTHVVTVYGYIDNEKWFVFDQYKPGVTEVPWEYEFGGIMKFNLKGEEPMPIIQIDNNTLVQLVEGGGGFGLVLDNKIIIDDLDKILSSFIVRNNGKIEGKVRALPKDTWDSFPKINLKFEPVNN